MAHFDREGKKSYKFFISLLRHNHRLQYEDRRYEGVLRGEIGAIRK